MNKLFKNLTSDTETPEGAEGFERTLESFIMQLSDESKDVQGAVICALVDKMKEQERIKIKVKQDNIQQNLESVNIEISKVDTKISQTEAAVKTQYAAEFARLEEEKIKLEAKVELELITRTIEERKEKAVLQAQKEALLKLSQQLEVEYQSPTSGLPCCSCH